MTHKFRLILLLGLLLASPQLAGCAEVKSVYPILDSGKRGLGIYGWLDNDRVLFYSEQRAQAKPGDGPGPPPVLEAGHYIWDTTAGTLSKDSSLGGVSNFCVRGDRITFLRRSPADEKQLLVVTRLKGQEMVAPLVNAQWFNRFSCRYYEQKPDWDRGHPSLPLLEEHGSLFWKDSRQNNPIMFYFPNNEKGISLPIGTRQVWHNLVQYAPFKNAYLLWGYSYIDKATGTEYPYVPPDKSQSIWWLTSDGQVKEQAIPMKSWMRKQEYYAIRDGLLVASRGITDLGDPGVAGGYILKPGTEQKLIRGLLENVVVSPDGCKVAFLHDPYTKEPVFERVKVKVITVCEEARHVH